MSQNTEYMYRTRWSTNKFLAMLCLLTIPGLNIILLFYWAFFQDTSNTRRYFSRALLIWLGIMLFLVLTYNIINYYIGFEDFLILPQDVQDLAVELQ
jgi:hypothetical protein